VNKNKIVSLSSSVQVHIKITNDSSCYITLAYFLTDPWNC